MFQVARVTDALPARDSAVDESIPAFVLLPHQFDTVISDHPDFASGCRVGFEHYCEDGADCIVTRRDLRVFIGCEMCRSYCSVEALCGLLSLPGRAGYCLGFLSALAFARRDLALLGLDYLTCQIPRCYRDEVRHGCNPLVAVPALRECR